MGKVINLCDCPEGWRDDATYVYIGRNKSQGARGWGNPYVLSQDTDDRNEVLSLYLAWLQRQLVGNQSLAQRIHSLHDKVLICHCKPHRCHGDFLSAIAEGLEGYEKQRREKVKEWRDWGEITPLGDQERRLYLQDLVRHVVVEHGKLVLHDMSEIAQYAAKMELVNQGDYKVAFKKFRMEYLDPLLKWELPVYRDAISQGDF